MVKYMKRWQVILIIKEQKITVKAKPKRLKYIKWYTPLLSVQILLNTNLQDNTLHVAEPKFVRAASKDRNILKNKLALRITCFGYVLMESTIPSIGVKMPIRTIETFVSGVLSFT